MKNFTLIACLTLGLISCSNTGYEKKIPGSWCEPISGYLNVPFIISSNRSFLESCCK